MPAQPKRHQKPENLGPVFRKATLDDWPRIKRIFWSSFKGQIPQRQPFRDYYNFSFVNSIENLSHHFNLAVVNNRVVGFTIIESSPKADTADLAQIAVDPAFQGRGIGKALIQEAEKAARDFNKPGMQLTVREDNASAIGFYEKQGYHPVATLPNYYWFDKVNGIRMEKQIVAAGQDNAKKTAKPRVIKR